VPLEGLSQLKNPLILSGIETATFRERKIKRTKIEKRGEEGGD
jgi:hypothetical protein